MNFFYFPGRREQPYTYHKRTESQRNKFKTGRGLFAFEISLIKFEPCGVYSDMHFSGMLIRCSPELTNQDCALY